MRYLSVCSGIEAATVAWHPLGWEAFAYSEIEAFPAAVLAHHYPNTPNFGDMTKFKDWPDATIDILVGGTPCFAGHTLIATKSGLVPISQISVGDEVLTHLGRWRRVLATGRKPAITTLIHGQGHSDGIETTDDHPFYARQKERVWVGRDAGSWRSGMGEPDWKAAKDMVGQFWASPIVWPESEVPAIEAIGRERDAPGVTTALMRVAGRWLGDGWCRINDRRGYVLICCAKRERETVERELLDAGLRFSVSDERTTFRFQISSRALARWLINNFSSGARNKTVPTWLLGAPEDLRESFFQGYLAADGCKTTNGYRASTVSRGIALGLTLLAHTLGLSVSRRFVQVNRKVATIENREVREHGFYQLTFYHRSRSSVADGLHRWGLVRKLSRGRETTVFNLEVEEDNSYVADGIVVHNCQSFSVAGLRKGLADPRGNLMLTYLAIAAKYRPTWLVWENVPGVLSSNRGRDFGTFLAGLGQLGYGFAYRVLDAQYFGVAQRRRRVFVVGCLGSWRCAAAVLFERHSLSGNPAPRRETGEKITGTLGSRASSGGGFSTDFDLDGGLQLARCVTTGEGKRQDYETCTLVAHALRGEGFDASEDGTGRGTPLVPVAQPYTLAIRGRGDSHDLEYRQDGTANALLTPNGGRGGIGVGAIAFDCKASGQNGFGVGEVASTMRSMGHADSHQNGGGHLAVAFSENIRGEVCESSITRALQTSGGKPGQGYAAVRSGMQVRRLTPRECERLQGFPDDYTLITVRGKPAADGPRYKALGNSMAVPVMHWIGKRMQMVSNLQLSRDAA